MFRKCDNYLATLIIATAGIDRINDIEIEVPSTLHTDEVDFHLQSAIKLDVSTKWWKSVAKYLWIAINKRMKFGDGKGAAPFQSSIIYLGKNLNKFNSVFGKYGTLYVPHEEVSQDRFNPLLDAL